MHSQGAMQLHRGSRVLHCVARLSHRQRRPSRGPFFLRDHSPGAARSLARATVQLHCTLRAVAARGLKSSVDAFVGCNAIAPREPAAA